MAKATDNGTERLCLVLYGTVRAKYYLGGANARMLHDAAAKIERLRGLLREARLNFEHGFIDEEDSRQFVMRLNAELAETTGGRGDE